MSRWLAVLGAASLATAAQANAQAVPLAADEVARVASSRVIDLRLSQDSDYGRSPPMVRELLINRRVSGNAAIGLGLANFYSRRKAGSNWRTGDGTAPRARKPAVTFLLNF
jgi:hypothetical protein